MDVGVCGCVGEKRSEWMEQPYGSSPFSVSLYGCVCGCGCDCAGVSV